ncbi:major facilitator superfamily domain-containing protein 4A-like protein [Lates japonicus]|uniref:Major facilitator superfamily domain-containing protein 4A-like protein n=1 Tax=Lates japonicus TaxID=270547 RepID=A0AAD3MXB1_LATJO|nr:major facilitator superfamily domain-containing protein 4A-like protein [Lates japonicus]
MKLLDERIWLLFKRHWQQTLTYWSVFFSFGLCIAFLGPTILDLRCQTQSTLQQITWVFFSQQLFLLVGSSMGGLCKKTLLFSLSALLSCTLVISFVFAIIPLCHHVVLLSITMALAGKAMGVIDTIANLQLVKLYQKDSAIFLQRTAVFWVPTGTANASSSSDLQHLRSSLAGHGTALHNISQYPLHTEGVVITRVSYAFWIMALINLPVPAAVLALMYHERLLPCFTNSPRLLDRDTLSSTSPTGDSGQGHGNVFVCCNPAKLQGRPASFFILHALGGAILFITDGIIGSYAGFVYTYAVSPPLLMGHKTAGCLDSIFWASITAGRLAFIYLSYRYTAPRLLTLSLVGVILVQCLLLIFYTSRVFLFIGTCVLGLCISSVFPSMLAFTEDILDYKGCATTVLVTSASTGEMMLQLLVGLVIHSQGSYAFLLCCTIASFISFCLFLLLLYVQRIHRNCHTDSSENMDMKEKPKTEGS